MGKSAQSVDGLAYPPRTVRSPTGELLGTYFPSTRRVRLQDGRIFAVGAAGLVQDGLEIFGVLDVGSLVIRPLEVNK